MKMINCSVRIPEATHRELERIAGLGARLLADEGATLRERFLKS